MSHKAMNSSSARLCSRMDVVQRIPIPGSICMAYIGHARASDRKRIILGMMLSCKGLERVWAPRKSVNAGAEWSGVLSPTGA